MVKAENKALAAALRKARERLAESQAQFAARMGVNQATISRWEETGPLTGLGRMRVEQVIADIDRVHPIGTKA